METHPGGANGTEFSAEEKDLVIIGGGVAGYVAAIKAGQEGLKVNFHIPSGVSFSMNESAYLSLLSRLDGLH
jgi:anaerobic glycerol-3-phosphate dehydrogenase